MKKQTIVRLAALLLFALAAYLAIIGATWAHRAEDYQRLLKSDLQAALKEEPAGIDCFEKKEWAVYYFESQESIEGLLSVVKSGQSVLLKQESLKPVVVEIVVAGGQSLILQGEYLIVPKYGATAAVKIGEEKNKELWTFMDRFVKK